MLCEIINPSDPYTLETDDFVLAGVAIAVLGKGSLGLRSLDDDALHTPILFGWDAWFEANGVADLSAYLKEHAEQIADVMDSVLIGGRDERFLWSQLKGSLPEAEYREKLDAWIDKKRSSMNDIGSAARRWAAKLRRVHAEAATAATN